MVRAAIVESIAASIKALGTDIRLAWRRRAAGFRRRQPAEYERSLADSADRFELERRERARNRWQSSDGSLLGR